MIHPRALLCNVAAAGGLLAALVHLTLHDLAFGVSVVFLLLMYAALPAFVWLRGYRGGLWAGCAFAASFGYCLADAVLELAA